MASEGKEQPRASKRTKGEYEVLRAKLQEFGQEHALANWDSTSERDQASLLAELQAVDLAQLQKVCAVSIRPTAEQPSDDADAEEHTSAAPQPMPDEDVCAHADTTDAQRAAWRAQGLQMVADGKYGIVLMAGGQGTRLGSSSPKGCYCIGLPSGKSLFQLQAERLLRLRQLAATASGRPLEQVSLPWYIMTSEFTDAETRQFFERHQFFGLGERNVVFFQQGTMPCVDLQGKLLLETSGKVSRAPDGNGGLFRALHQAGCLEDMRTRGVQAVDCYCVDNALAKVGDPTFAGFCAARGAEVGARVCAKVCAEERMGVFALRGQPPAVQVVEYSELSAEAAASVVAAGGRLRFNWGNMAMHYFSLSFLQRAAAEYATGGMYHVARKRIPTVDGTTDGIKLELFIFDAFKLATKVALLEVQRSEQFAPVKNARGSPTDSPDTACALLLALHGKWLRAAGSTLAEGTVVEVSPLLSYEGEQLAARYDGKLFDSVSMSLEAPLSPEKP